jgi:hypothetical protein
MYWILIFKTHIIHFFYYITIKFGLSFQNARSVSHTLQASDEPTPHAII